MSPHSPAWRDAILARATGDLDPDLEPALQRHLAICPDCRRESDAWRQLAGQARAAMDPPPAPSLSLAMRKVRHAAELDAAPAPWRSAFDWRPLLALAGAAAVLALAFGPRREAARPVAEPPGAAIHAPRPADSPSVLFGGRRQSAGEGEAARESHAVPRPAPRLAMAAPPRVAAAPHAIAADPRPAGPVDPPAQAAPTGDGAAAPDGDDDARDPRPEVGPPATRVPAPPPAPTEPPAPPSQEPGPTSGATALPPATAPAAAPTRAVARIAGRVEDAEGRPVTWAIILLQVADDRGPRFYLTDSGAEGNFELEASAGRWELWVEPDGLPPVRYADEPVLDLAAEPVREGLVIRLPMSIHGSPTAAAPVHTATPVPPTAQPTTPAPQPTTTPA